MSQLATLRKYFIASLSQAGSGGQMLIEGVASVSIAQILAPPRKPRLKSPLRIKSPLEKKEEASDRPSPHHEAKLLISLPVEQQLLELKQVARKFRLYRVSVEEYASFFFCTDGIPRAPPPHGEESLRGASQQTIGNYCLSSNRAPGQDMLLFELLRCTSRLKQVALECINGFLTGDAPPPRSRL